MNTSFERVKNSTDEWYTPKYIIDALGEFDTDPCSPMMPPFKTANTMYNKENDGLVQEWVGRVWLNPPYSRPLINKFIDRMVDHNNGIALVFNRLDSKLFQEQLLDKATSMLVMKGRIKFLKDNGQQGGSAGCGSVLFAFGEENDLALMASGIEGKYIQLK